jgi:hypothetical protein
VTPKIEFIFGVDGNITTVSSADPSITRRASVTEAETPGYWITWLPDQENPYESTISGGYTSRDEALRAAETFVRTGDFTAPKGEPYPIWLDTDGAWQLIKVTQLWPLVPSGLLLDFAGGRAMLVRTWELKAKSKSVLKTYERGAQPRVSVVERRVMPEALAFKFRLQINLALMQGGGVNHE